MSLSREEPSPPSPRRWGLPKAPRRQGPPEHRRRAEAGSGAPNARREGATGTAPASSAGRPQRPGHPKVSPTGRAEGRPPPPREPQLRRGEPPPSPAPLTAGRTALPKRPRAAAAAVGPNLLSHKDMAEPRRRRRPHRDGSGRALSDDVTEEACGGGYEGMSGHAPVAQATPLPSGHTPVA